MFGRLRYSYGLDLARERKGRCCNEVWKIGILIVPKPLRHCRAWGRDRHKEMIPKEYMVGSFFVALKSQTQLLRSKHSAM